MLKTVIFDMDGVIVDSEPLHHAAYHAMFDEIGIEVSPEHYQTLTGRSTIDLCLQLKDHFPIKQPAEALVAMKRRYFDTLFEQDKTFDLIAGVRDLMEHYISNGLTLAVASSSSMRNIDRVFDRFSLNPYFSAKISGADLQASKPHPEIFLKAAKTTNTAPRNCLVIEDAAAGIQAAKAAGIFCVGYEGTQAKIQNLSNADLLITDFTEAYLEKIRPHFEPST